MNPKVSVVIPVFNREDLILKTLDSVLNQVVRPYELIVVDNASSDNSFLNVKRWMDSHNDSGIIFKLLTQDKKGACPTRQKGLENVKGEYVIFFDSDDLMNPSLLKEASSVLNKKPATEIVCWSCRIHQLDGSTRIPPFNPSAPIENHLIHALLRPQGYLVKKSFLEKAGGWSKNIPVWNDFELGTRLLLQDPKIEAINEILAEIFAQKESITGTDFSSKQGLWENVLNEIESMVDNSSHSQKNKFHKIIDYRRVILAAIYSREKNNSGAQKLLTQTLIKKSLSEKIILKFTYHYTRWGFRGAWRLVGNFF